MPQWMVEYQNHDWETVAKFDPINPVVVFKKDEPSTFTCEIPLSDPQLTYALIGPKRIDVRLWRDDNPVFDGEIREVNLEEERDTLMVEHSDFKQYLDDRTYPYNWPWVRGQWPVMWENEDIATVAQEIVEAMLAEDPNVPPFEVNALVTGVVTKYEIHFADNTTVWQHLKNLGDREDGFDIRVNRTGDHIDLVLLHPKADDEEIVYTITKDVGRITRFNWTNRGPDGTWVAGIGSGQPAPSNIKIFTHEASREQFRRRDWIVDFGTIRNYAQLASMTAAEYHRALFPQKELELGILVNVEDLPNFWAKTMNRPESLLGRRIWVGKIRFYNYWIIDAAFKILDMTIEIDQDGNEFVTFGLEMIDG